MLLREHVRTVRATYPNLGNSSVRIIVERNLGFEAEHLYRECKDIENSRFVCEPAVTLRVGVLTTQERKLAFVTYTNVLLRENRVFAHSTNWVDTQKNDTRKIILDQLSFFGFTFMRPDNSFQKEKFALSGKSAGGKDDLCTLRPAPPTRAHKHVHTRRARAHTRLPTRADMHTYKACLVQPRDPQRAPAP